MTLEVSGLVGERWMMAIGRGNKGKESGQCAFKSKIV
jgi:hypothetical protein